MIQDLEVVVELFQIVVTLQKKGEPHARRGVFRFDSSHFFERVRFHQFIFLSRNFLRLGDVLYEKGFI